ncbi:hypothetical protein KUCAC02_015298, partial [Chaenocephalus aceratus]
LWRAQAQRSSTKPSQVNIWTRSTLLTGEKIPLCGEEASETQHSCHVVCVLWRGREEPTDRVRGAEIFSNKAHQRDDEYGCYSRYYSVVPGRSVWRENVLLISRRTQSSRLTSSAAAPATVSMDTSGDHTQS